MKIYALLLSVVCVSATAATTQRAWTVEDIVEVSEITNLALSEDGSSVAFVLKQGSVADNTIHYELYQLDTHSKALRKLMAAAYIAEVARHSHSSSWTALADRGQGVQLYAITDDARVSTLLENPDTSVVGAYEGWIGRSSDGPRPMGIISYHWAPDGKSLWYSRARNVSPSVQTSIHDTGLIYDDTSMTEHAFPNHYPPLSAIELHTYEPATHTDRIIASVPSTELDNGTLFRSDIATASWSPDGKTLRYLAPGAADEKTAVRSLVPWLADLSTGETHPLQGDSLAQRYETIPVDASTAVMIDTKGDSNHLIEVSMPGGQQRVLSNVDYLRFSEGPAVWKDEKNKRLILQVHWRDHDGLTTWPQSKLSRALAKTPDFITNCALATTRSPAVCVRQSLTLAPEIVAISLSSGAMTVLARPNARYDEIAPLISKHQQWVNKYGNITDGYVTYPRNYDPHKKYPTILVTHGHDAQNRFLYQGFQWDFPVQVWAERGYVVLSVNEPHYTAKTWAALEAFGGSGPKVDVEAQQFSHGFDAIAGMEAALRGVIDQGIADPQITGIAGYSRGSEVVELVMTHSHLFKVASDGDAGGWNAGVYWAVGAAEYRELFRRLYGGSPYDPAVQDNYRRYAPSNRAEEFAGPLLQQFTAANAPLGLELHTLLRDHNIPTQLVAFPQESHLFWQPAHRQAALQRNLDWFDYWLQTKRSSDPARDSEYVQWDKMKQTSPFH